MIYRNLHGSKQKKLGSLNYSVPLAFAVAKSIDALVIGINFAFLKSPLFKTTILIGSVTFFMSF
jgi:putative Mn2+ efflux pump MntP